MKTASVEHAAGHEQDAMAWWISQQAQGQQGFGTPQGDVLQNIPRAVVARFECPRGRRITCVTGTLWLTFVGALLPDLVLAAGQSTVCERDDPLLISTLGMPTWRADSAALDAEPDILLTL